MVRKEMFRLGVGSSSAVAGVGSSCFISGIYENSIYYSITARTSYSIWNTIYFFLFYHYLGYVRETPMG
jgi:hypothetical protein